MKAKQRHELKHDKYVDGMIAVGARLRRHPRALVAGGIGVALAVGVTIWLMVSARTAEAESWEQAEVGDRSMRAVAAYEAQTEMLQQRGRWLRDARIPKLLDQMKAKRAEELETAAAAYEKTCGLYPRSKAAKFARYRLGGVLRRQKRFEEAAAVFEEILEQCDGPPELLAWTRRSLAVMLEELGKFADAAGHHEILAESESDLLAAAASWDAGRCWEAAGEAHLAAAKTAYDRTLELASSSSWGELARFRLDQLARPRQPEPKARAGTKVKVKPKGTRTRARRARRRAKQKVEVKSRPKDEPKAGTGPRSQTKALGPAKRAEGREKKESPSPVKKSGT